MNEQIWKSRLAKRLVRTFSVLIASSIVATVLVLGNRVHEGILETVGNLGKVSAKAVKDAGDQFQRLGETASRQSSERTAQISIGAVKSMSGKMERTQLDTMAATVRNFSTVSKASLDAAITRSTATNSAALGRLSDQMTTLVSRSTRDAQARAAHRVESSDLAMTGAELTSRARYVATDINDYIRTYQGYLSLTAEMPELSGGKVDGDQATLDALVRRYPMLTRVSEIDTSGKEIVTSSADEIITPAQMGRYGDASFFKTAVAGANYDGVLQEMSEDGAPVVRLAVPIDLYRGKAVGVLMADLSLSDLWDSLRDMRFGQGGYVYVLNERGKALLAPPRTTGPVLSRGAKVEGFGWQTCDAVPLSQVMQPIRALESEINASAQQAIIQMRGSIKESGRVTAAQLSEEARSIHEATDSQLDSQSQRAIDALKATTARQAQSELGTMQVAIQAQSSRLDKQNSSQMESATAASTRQIAQRISPIIVAASSKANEQFMIFALAITLVSCGIACLVALYLAGGIVRPVVRLVHGTNAIAAGDLNKRVDENAPDEIGDLAAAFNQMAESLSKSRGDLQDAEAQLVQSAKLASLGTLSAGVAHELNQPLAIIRGLSQQLAGEPGLTEDAIADLKMIEGQTTRMTKIIKHLRTFCRAGGYELAHVDVNEVVNNCFILIGAQLKAHNIDVLLDLSEQAPPVMADANELEQVFLNLITNSRDAIEDRDDARITIQSSLRDGRFVIEFRDNGPGVPDEVASQMFDPFFTTKEAGKGTGLGLSISHSIIKKHQGSIDFHNDYGAVFTIQLPLAEAGQPEEVYRAA